MVTRWMGAALLTSWLGVAGSAAAQGVPVGAPLAPPPPPAAADPGAVGGAVPPPGAGFMPGPYMAPGWDPSCPPGGGPGECLPPNSWSAPPWPTVGPHHFHIGAEYLWWWVKKRHVPGLVTTGRLDDIFPGALNQPGTVPVIGPGSVDDNDSQGARVKALWWFDNCQTCGLDASGFILENKSLTSLLLSTGLEGDFTFARPFRNANTGLQDADPVAIPNVQGGGILVSLPRRMYGGDLNFRLAQEVSALSTTKLSWLLGVRYVSLDEKVEITQGMFDLPGDGALGNFTAVHDNFTTYNRFYGGQIGADTEWRLGQVVLNLTAKVAFGTNRRSINIDGYTSLEELANNRLVTNDGTRGLLAQPTNVGKHGIDGFSVVPEATLTLAWDFNGYVRIWAGYNFMYWSNIYRPGDQIDTTINVQPLLAPGINGTPLRPTVPYHTSDLWVQGLTFGLAVSW